jgi:hypothetical protein
MFKSVYIVHGTTTLGLCEIVCKLSMTGERNVLLAVCIWKTYLASWSAQNFIAYCAYFTQHNNETIAVYVLGFTFINASINDNCLIDGFLKEQDNISEKILSNHFAFINCYPTGFTQNVGLEFTALCTDYCTIRVT